MTNMSEVVSGLSFWPTNVINSISSHVVSSFDSIGESFVVQENFTNTFIIHPGVFFSGQVSI